MINLKLISLPILMKPNTMLIVMKLNQKSMGQGYNSVAQNPTWQVDPQYQEKKNRKKFA